MVIKNVFVIILSLIAFNACYDFIHFIGDFCFDNSFLFKSICFSILALGLWSGEKKVA